MQLFGPSLDAIYVRPVRGPKKGLAIPARFDTALVNVGLGKETSVEGATKFTSIFTGESIGYRTGQIRVVFPLPGGEAHAPLEHLANVEWFSEFASPECDHGMHKLKRTMQDGARVVSIIPVSSIRRSVHLFPKFGRAVLENWTLDSVLEKRSIFYLSPFVDRNMYFTL